ncbi:MAG: formylglycine-generating enzyme family protein [Nitrospirae bacterium]|nr:MAG: formylglycine-generating enzyme family protein [Nitrospirota bacterium]
MASCIVEYVTAGMVDLCPYATVSVVAIANRHGLGYDSSMCHRRIRMRERGERTGALISTWLACMCIAGTTPVVSAEAPPELAAHMDAIANLAVPSPMVNVPEGWFIMGTGRKDDTSYGLHTQFDDTEQPQRRIWLDAFAIDRDEGSLGEYVAFLREHRMPASEELQKLIRHMVTVHFMPDYVMARWPALYVTWNEAAEFCTAHGKRLPTEAEWEKAARGTDGNLFPWGSKPPVPGLAVFGKYHAHEIPLVAAVNSGEEGQSLFGARHMAGNIAEWVQDWFGIDYYAVMPERNPKGPTTGRYRSVRGGSWRSSPNILRAATRNGAVPDQRSATIGFRCAK